MAVGKMHRRKFFGLAAASVLGVPMFGRHSLAQTNSGLRLGSLCPLTGGGASFGAGMQLAMKLAAADINASTDMLGGKLEIFYEDSQTNPDAGVRAAQKLIQINKVQALLGTWSSGVTMAVAPICIADKVVNMSFSGSTDIRDMKSDDYVWQNIGSNLAYGIAFAAHAKAIGIKRAAFMAFNNPSGLTLANVFKTQMAQSGVDVNVVTYNPNQSSYRPEIRRALANNPELIALGSYIPDTTIILREGFSLGATNKWMGVSWAITPSLLSALNADVTNGAISIGPVNNLEHPHFSAFSQRYEAESGSALMNNVYAAGSYDVVVICALAALAAKSNVASDFHGQIRAVTGTGGKKVYSFKEGLAALAAGEKIDYDGIGGDYAYDAFGEARPRFGRWVANNGVLTLEETFQI